MSNYWGWLTILTCVLCAGCSGPQSTLDPAGPASLIISWLWWGMFLFFSLVLVVVVILWVYAMGRKHRAPSEEHAKRVHTRWLVGGGLVLPLVSVTALLALGIPAGQHVALLPLTAGDPLRVEVVGHRWWWEVRYPESGVVVANQFHLPVDRTVDVYLTSADVIHSFWVPRLAGKMDLIPGRTHHLRLQASATGIMRGQCAEFCGSGHAHMVFDVEAHTAANFDAWLQQRQQSIEVPAEHRAAADAFREHCGHCHEVSGVSSAARQSAPNLSDVGVRRLLGVGRRDQERIGVERWLETHPTFLEGGSTPDHRTLAVKQRGKIAAWLETLGND